MAFKSSVFFAFLIAVFSVTEQLKEDFVGLVSQNYNERLNSRLEQQILHFHNQELAYKAYASYFDRADVALPGFKNLFEQQARRAQEHAINMTAFVNLRGGRVRFPVVQLKDACKSISNALIEQSVTSSKQTTDQTFPPRSKPYICYFQSLHPDPFLTHKKKSPKTSKKSFWFFSKPDTKVKDESSVEDIKREQWHEGLFGLEDALAMEKSINADLLDLINVAASFKDPHTHHTLEVNLMQQVDAIYKLAHLTTRLRQYQAEQSYDLGEYLLDREIDNTVA